MARRILQCCFVIMAFGMFAEVCAVDTVPSVYQRIRVGGKTGNTVGGNYPGGGYWGGGYYQPWIGTQFYAGTWYQRPYPYHFDYYRQRYSVPAIPLIEPDSPSECCLGLEQQ